MAAAGAVVATVGQDQQSYFQVMALLRGKTRKRAAPGMEAHIVPDSIKKEEYGSMRGRVIAVSDEDVSVEHVEQIVHNDLLTKNLFGGEPALLAYVELVPTKDNPSGFEWWSGYRTSLQDHCRVRRHSRHHRRTGTADHLGHSGAAQAAQHRGMTSRLLFWKRRVRTPTVFQMEMVESGAAALGIVLAYYGRRVPLEELRVACGVSREGSKPADLVRAAESYGLDAVITPAEADRVLARPFPVIVQWNVDQFLVVEGVAGSKVYLNDPGTGPREVARKEFSDSFKGVSLELRKGAGFSRGGAGPGLMSKLGRRLKGLDGTIGFIAWISLMLVLPGLIVPGMTAVFVDNILIRQFEGWLGPMLIGLGATALVNIVLRWLQGVALLRLELRLALEQSAKFTWHVLSLPDRLLHAALYGRSREPGRSERQGRHAARA